MILDKFILDEGSSPQMGVDFEGLKKLGLPVVPRSYVQFNDRFAGTVAKSDGDQFWIGLPGIEDHRSIESQLSDIRYRFDKLRERGRAFSCIYSHRSLVSVAKSILPENLIPFFSTGEYDRWACWDISVIIRNEPRIVVIDIGNNSLLNVSGDLMEMISNFELLEYFRDIEKDHLGRYIMSSYR